MASVVYVDPSISEHSIDIGNAPVGRIVSHNSYRSQQYGHNISSTLTLIGNNSGEISIRFTNFKLGLTHCADYLKITSKEMEQYFCNEVADQKSHIFTTDQLSLNFVTGDKTMEKRVGFLLTYNYTTEGMY